MKRLISLVAVLACMAVGYAQSSLVATLNHGEAVSVYYGYGALAEAYEAATHGDLITLSSGMFKSVDLAKNITVRGAGAGATDDCTRLDGQFYILGVPDTVSGHLTLEGLYNDDYVYYGSYNNSTDIKNAHFIKCCFSYFSGSGQIANMLNAMFVQCKISEHILLNLPGDKANFFNCYLAGLQVSSDKSSDYTFNNCLLKGGCYYWANSLFTNCILWDTSTGFIPSSSQASYCLGMNDSPGSINIFENLYPHNQYGEMVGTSDANTIFKTFTGTYSDTETFELTDEAKAKYVGTDGREVGIYGGNFPFTFKSDLPKITKFNVASQSTEDGKLKVEIEVSGVE